MPLAVFAFGALSVALLFWAYDITERRRVDFNFSEAALRIQLEAALSHLWLEENVAGDTTTDMNEILAEMESSVTLAQSLLESLGSDQGLDSISKEEPSLRTRVEAIAGLTTRLRQVALERARNPESSGIGTKLDQAFDTVFDELIAKAVILGHIAQQNERHNQVRTKQLLMGVIAIWVLIVVIASIGAWQRELQKKMAEEALRDAHDELECRVEERTAELSRTNEQLRKEIAERTSAEEALRESESKFRKLFLEFNALLDAIPDRITLLSPDFEILWANKSATAGSGKDCYRLTGEQCYEVWHHRATPCLVCPAKNSLLTGEPESMLVSTPDGRAWDVRTFPIMNEDGIIASIIDVAAEVTEKLALQQEAMRAAHLASVGELAAGVAHEVNNPLNGIINYAQILVNVSETGSERHDIASRIIKEGMRISGIVKSLLAFARERKEGKVPAHVHGILKESLVLTDSQIRRQGIHVSIDMPSDLPEVMMNPHEIEQVFLNLISNAMYALNEKYPEAHEDKVLSIMGREMKMGGVCYLGIAFYDHGIGIPPSIMDKVLNPFYSTKPGGKGTGLGLSISHGLVQDHGGRLRIESKEGEFTRVTVLLPVQEGRCNGENTHCG